MTIPQALSLGKTADTISKKLTTDEVSVQRTAVSTAGGAAMGAAASGVITVGAAAVGVAAAPIAVPLAVASGIAGAVFSFFD